jgi:hypothetical protein
MVPFCEISIRLTHKIVHLGNPLSELSIEPGNAKKELNNHSTVIMFLFLTGNIGYADFTMNLLYYSPAISYRLRTAIASSTTSVEFMIIKISARD